MSPSATLMLEKQIYPIIGNTIPRTARPIGSEDSQELIQDATASAAEMLESMEKSGRKPLPNSIAYYSIQRTKSGRRSYGDNRTDVMFPGYQMDHECSLCSMQDPICDDDDATVGDTIAFRSEDTASKVLRKIDWQAFLDTLDARKRRIVEEMMLGYGTGDIARLLAVTAAGYRAGAANTAKLMEQSADKFRVDLRQRAQRSLLIFAVITAVLTLYGDEILEYLRTRFSTIWKIPVGSQRKDIPEIPVRAISEAIINSLCHRDFSNEKGNEIAIFKNRIEIYNPGRFPTDYSPADFIEGRERSVLRNPRIANTLFLTSDIERWGSGLKRIIE